MLDYYSTIPKSQKEVDQELILMFKNIAPTDTMKIIISDLREEKVIANDYSITGWNMFAKKQLYEIILIELNYTLQKNKKKLTATHCLYKMDLNADIINSILNK